MRKSFSVVLLLILQANAGTFDIKSFAEKQKNVIGSPSVIKQKLEEPLHYQEPNDINNLTDEDKKNDFLNFISKTSNPNTWYYTCKEIRKIKTLQDYFRCDLTGKTFISMEQCEENCVKQYDCNKSRCVFVYECEYTDQGDLCPIERQFCLFQNEEPNQPCPPEAEYDGKVEPISYDVNEGKCYHAPICEDGFAYEKNRDRCERDAEYYEDPVTASKHCPNTHFSYNSSSDRCEYPALVHSRPADTCYVNCNPHSCNPHPCNPHPCNCVCVSYDEDGNCIKESCSTCWDTCYDTCYDKCPVPCCKGSEWLEGETCYWYQCDYGGSLSGSLCVAPVNCNASHSGAFFNPSKDVCYWYQCDPPYYGSLWIYFDGIYKGICYKSVICKFGSYSSPSYLDGNQDRCEFDPCPIAGVHSKCVYSSEEWDTANWDWAESQKAWKCSAIPCNKINSPEQRSWCVQRDTSIHPLNSNQVKTWFCEYPNEGGYLKLEDCEKACNWYQCTHTGNWYQGAEYKCLENCREKGNCFQIKE
jgi:hypothetical protein